MSKKVVVKKWADIDRPVVGVIHLKPLPGAPRFRGDVRQLKDSAMRDLEALVAGGAHGVLIENFGDTPFLPGRVDPHVVSHMTAIIASMRRKAPSIPMGINVLRNDAKAALAIAQAVGASFIRVNVLCGARVTDQGVVEGVAGELLRYRKELGAEHIQIFADVDVKHSSRLGSAGSYGFEDEAADMIERGGADALIVSGTGTGKEVDMAFLKLIQSAAAHTPVFVGSGTNLKNAPHLTRFADGFIVGSSIKKGGDISEGIDRREVAKLIDVIRKSIPSKGDPNSIPDPEDSVLRMEDLVD